MVSFCCRRFPACTAVPLMDTETLWCYDYLKIISLSSPFIKCSMSLGYNSNRLLKNKTKGSSQKWDIHHLPGDFKLSHAHTFSLDASAVLTQTARSASCGICLFVLPPTPGRGEAKETQTTAKSFISSTKFGYNNQPVSQLRLIPQGARKSFAHGLATHSRAGWGIVQLGGMPVIPRFWDFWIHLNIRWHKALSCLCRRHLASPCIPLPHFVSPRFLSQDR